MAKRAPDEPPARAHPTSQQVSVLFVCMGNICRSPTAEGVFRARAQREGLAEKIFIDSAGTRGYHVGAPPDRRAQEAARRRGYDLSTQRAQQVTAEDCARFDYLLAMDRPNLERLRLLCPQRDARLFLSFAADIPELEVPDPYYGGEEGFERVLDLIEAASEGLLAEIRKNFLSAQR